MELLNKINLEDLGVWGITCSIIACLLYFAFRSYLNKKFENIATIEDARKINTIVEEIKTKYQADTENLKAQLSILTNKNNVIFQEEKNALVSFLSEWNVWYQSLDLMYFNYNEENYIELKNKAEYFTNLSNKVYSEKSKIELFINNYELNTSMLNLLSISEKFNKLVVSHCIKIYFSFEKINLYNKNIINEDFKDVSKKDLEEKIEIIKSDLTKNIEIFYDDKLNLILDLTLIKSDFIEISKRHLLNFK